MESLMINLCLFIAFLILFILITFPRFQRSLEEKWGTSDIVKIIIICSTVIAVASLVKLGILFDSFLYKSITFIFILLTLCGFAYFLIILRDFNDKVELLVDSKKGKYNVFILYNELKKEYKFDGKVSSFGKFLENKKLSRFEKPIVWNIKTNTGHHILKPIVKILSLLPNMPSPFTGTEANGRLFNYFITSDKLNINITSDNISKALHPESNTEMNTKFAEILKKAKNS